MMRNRAALAMVLQLLAAGFFMSSAAAQSASVPDLIEERTIAELGATLPADAEIDIRMAKGMIERGNFIQEFWIDADTGQFIANVATEDNLTQRVWGIAMVTLFVAKTWPWLQCRCKGLVHMRSKTSKILSGSRCAEC